MSKTITELVAQGLSYPSRFVTGRMQSAKQTLATLAPGQGGVVEMNGKKVAAYKDAQGNVTLHSAVCTHMQCIVQWNGTDKTFDCPCHGSRFAADGSLKQGPAARGLDPV